MVSRQVIDEVLSQKTLALVGVSRNGAGFGNTIRKELAGKGYSILLVHPEAETIAGVPCARSLKDVASRVGGVILVTPPASTSALVREAAEAGIRRIWMQQGAESPEAIRFCEQQGLAADTRMLTTMLPIGDGVALSVKRDGAPRKQALP
jgi:predicted CoA-binding protein